MPTSQAHTSLKTQLSLSALFFFAPFIDRALRQEGSFELDSQEMDFIHGYVRLGYFSGGLFLLGIILGISDYLSPFGLAGWLYWGVMIALLILLLGGSLAILTDTPVQKRQKPPKEIGNEIHLHESSLKNTLLDYLPLISTYRRYQLRQFNTPNLILKESLLVWTIFGLLCFTQIPLIIVGFLLLIGIRMITLAFLGDLLPQHLTISCTNLFYKNVEEIWGRLFGIPSKITYSYLYPLSAQSTIQYQYIVLCGGLLFLLLYGWPLTVSPYVWIGLIILLAKYILLAWNWKHLPPLPILQELHQILYSFIKK